MKEKLCNDVEKKSAEFLKKPYTESFGEKIENEPRQGLENLALGLMEDNRMLSSIISNLPCGVCEVAFDKHFTLLYGNESFFLLYGRTPEQMREELQNRLEGTVFPEDLPRVRQTVDKAHNTGKDSFEAEHRIVRRDGSLIWGLIRGSFFDGNGGKTMHCVIVDITQRKQMEQELRINEERFRIALEQMDNTIFDYNIRTRVMNHAYKSAEVYGLTKEMENVPESLVENGTIHPDSVPGYLEMYRKICAGAPGASSVVQTRLTTGRYVWRKITMTNIFDCDGKAVRAIGILEDIDEQKRREELLRNQMERDTLTGLFNKGATEAHIQTYLSQAPADEYNALLIIDIDDFKSVNDRYGHLYGDRVLAESARRISALFYADDIIGRIGGDEFAVFIKRMRDAASVWKKAAEVCGAFAEEFNFNGIITSVSCSVGTAAAPTDGKTFEELYQKSDIALYEAKRSGKNRCSTYRASMGAGVYRKPYSSTQIDPPENIQ